jgi:hypothetical protein
MQTETSNNQIMFTKMVNHLRKQNSKSMTGTESDPICMYRSEDGKMCAVGCLIADEVYTFRLEDMNSSSNIVMRALDRSGFDIYTYSATLISDMQTLHDRQPVSKWEDGFKSIAAEYKLKLPEKI